MPLYASLLMGKSHKFFSSRARAEKGEAKGPLWGREGTDRPNSLGEPCVVSVQSTVHAGCTGTGPTGRGTAISGRSHAPFRADSLDQMKCRMKVSVRKGAG